MKPDSSDTDVHGEHNGITFVVISARFMTLVNVFDMRHTVSLSTSMAREMANEKQPNSVRHLPGMGVSFQFLGLDGTPSHTALRCTVLHLYLPKTCSIPSAIKLPRFRH